MVKKTIVYSLLSLLFLFGGITISEAQQSVLLNQTSFNTYLVNPSAIGLTGHAVVNCHYKKNWLGFAESPEVTQVTADGVFNHSKGGAGITILKENAGIFSNTYFSMALRHRLKLTKEVNFSFGLSGGFNRQLSDFSKLKAESPEEFTQLPSQQAVTVPDAAIGALFIFKKLHFGASANHILNQNIVFKEPVFNSELQFKPLANYVFYLQHRLQIANDWELAGNLLLRTTHGLPVQPDLSATVEYRKIITLTGGYRPSLAIYTGFGIKLSERFTVRYFYEYSRQINAISLGGHEIGIRFSLAKEKMTEPEKKPEENLDEIYEKMEKYEQDLNSVKKKADSLDRNVSRLQTEIERLRNQQLSSDEINKAIDNYFGSSKNAGNQAKAQTPAPQVSPENYRIIKTTGDENQPYDTIKGNYRVVYGVYQLLNYAKEFQKLIKRETGHETLLIEIPGHPKKYLYVCDFKEHGALKPALKQLRDTNAQLDGLNIEITKGKPWILQISKD